MLLDAGCDVNIIDRDGANILQMLTQVCRRSSTNARPRLDELIPLLVGCGVNAGAVDHEGSSVLHKISSSSISAKTIDVLLKSGAHVNGILELLIKHGLDINARDRQGTLPLYNQ